MTSSSDSVRVLLVEDSESDVALTQEVLAETAPRVQLDVARDGVDALAYLDRRADTDLPDLILLDLNMPRMGGQELLERLKAHAVWRRIPVIILTTSNAAEDVVATYERHANSYITKPFDLTGFIEVMAQIESYWLSVVQLPSRVRA